MTGLEPAIFGFVDRRVAIAPHGLGWKFGIWVGFIFDGAGSVLLCECASHANAVENTKIRNELNVARHKVYPYHREQQIAGKIGKVLGG